MGGILPKFDLSSAMEYCARTPKAKLVVCYLDFYSVCFAVCLEAGYYSVWHFLLDRFVKVVPLSL